MKPPPFPEAVVILQRPPGVHGLLPVGHYLLELSHAQRPSGVEERALVRRERFRIRVIGRACTRTAETETSPVASASLVAGMTASALAKTHLLGRSSP